MMRRKVAYENSCLSVGQDCIKLRDGHGGYGDHFIYLCGCRRCFGKGSGRVGELDRGESADPIFANVFIYSELLCDVRVL
ncbi:hypothetical protein D3C77_440210 [compost metagenome]